MLEAKARLLLSELLSDIKKLQQEEKNLDEESYRKYLVVYINTIHGAAIAQLIFT